MNHVHTEVTATTAMAAAVEEAVETVHKPCIEFFGSSILIPTVRRFNVLNGRRLNWLKLVNKPIEEEHMQLVEQNIFVFVYRLQPILVCVRIN